LIGVIFLSVLEGPLFGAWFGTLTGIYPEIFSTGPIGYQMAAVGFIGLFAGLCATKVFRDSFLIQLFLPVLSFYLFVLWNAVISKTSLGDPIEPGILLESLMPGDLLATLLVSPLIFWVLRKLARGRRLRSYP
jgi:cell shape-determining protein MreD